MADEGVERAVAARTYRRIAAQLDIEAALLRAQAESFADAATRVEEGEDVDSLQLPAPERGEEDPTDQELWQRRRNRILRAVADASRKPAAEVSEATLDRIAEEAGEDPQDVDDVKLALDGMIRAGLVEAHRIAAEGPRPMVVFLPTRAGFEEIEYAAPGSRMDTVLRHGHMPERTVFDEVEQPTREMAAVEPTGFALFRRVHGEPTTTFDAWLGYELSDAMKALIDSLPEETIKSPYLIAVINEMAESGEPITALTGQRIAGTVRQREAESVAAGDR